MHLTVCVACRCHWHDAQELNSQRAVYNTMQGGEGG